MQALIKSNANLARQTIDQDQRVNRLEVEIDALCCNAIACYKPTASDLRLIVTSTKIIMHLERIGDEAKKIAHISERRAQQYNLVMPRFSDIGHATGLTMESLKDVLDSFARLDFISARKVIDRNGLGKEKFDSILRNLVEFMTENPHAISTLLECLLITKAIERISDHVKFIAELVMESSNRYYDMQHQQVPELEIK
jgi:phosphate transport system protein